MGEHTKGPWRVGVSAANGLPCIDADDPNYPVEIAECWGVAEDGYGLVEDDACRANAERIVACVNALEGYNPAAVRDVVDALQDFVDGVEYASGVTDTDDDPVATVAHQYDMIVGDQYRKAIAALAALEGGAA